MQTEPDVAVPGHRSWRKTLRRLWSADSPIEAAAGPAQAPPAPAAESARPRRALGYLLRERGAVPEQLGPQIDEIHGWCDAAGVALQDVVHDVAGAGEQRARPSLQWALAQIANREADMLVVARLGDLSGSVTTLSPLLRWFMDGRRALVAIDLGLDTSTREGQLAAEAVAGVGTLQRERISAGTRRGLEAARSRGGGHGRIAVADVPELNARIARMREKGMTLQAIADVLNEDGVPTLRGGTMWRPSSVQRATGYRRPPTSGGIPLPNATSGLGRLQDA